MMGRVNGEDGSGAQAGRTRWRIESRSLIGDVRRCGSERDRALRSLGIRAGGG